MNIQTKASKKALQALNHLDLPGATVKRITSGVNTSIALGRYNPVFSDYHTNIIENNIETNGEVRETIYKF